MANTVNFGRMPSENEDRIVFVVIVVVIVLTVATHFLLGFVVRW